MKMSTPSPDEDSGRSNKEVAVVSGASSADSANIGEDPMNVSPENQAGSLAPTSKNEEDQYFAKGVTKVNRNNVYFLFGYNVAESSLI